jgi:hypothetical protein
MIQEQNNYIAESKEDFAGFEILYAEHYKPGVRRVFMRRMNTDQTYGSFYIVFSREEYLEGLLTDEMQ